MVQPVAALEHLMTGTDIKHPVVFRAVQRACFKWNVGIGSFQTDGSQPIPVFGILHHSNDFLTLRLSQILLAEDKEIEALPGVKAAEQIQLHRNAAGGEKLEGRIVVFHHDLPTRGFYTGEVSI